MNTASRPHDEAVVELLREDPAFSAEYLAVALGDADEPGGQEALLQALRHVAEAQGVAKIAERAGLPRESLYKSLSKDGNPSFQTIAKVIHALGGRLTIQAA